MLCESIIAKNNYDIKRRSSRKSLSQKYGLVAKDGVLTRNTLLTRDRLLAKNGFYNNCEPEDNKLENISKTVAEYMDNLRKVKENDKIYIGNDKKVYIDKWNIFQSIKRTFLFRSRYNTIEELEKLFKSYFILIDNIFAHDKNNDALIQYHSILIDDWVKGMANLKFTYEESRRFRARADILMIKLLSIRRDIRDLNYKEMHVRSYSC